MDFTIYVYWKREIDEDARKAVIDGVKTFVEILKNTDAIGMPDDEVVLCGVDSELEAFVHYTPKVGELLDAGAICRKVNLMNSGRSIGIYLTDEPLSGNGIYVVGYSFGGITVSTHHYQRVSGSERLESLKLCVMHELGHLHGMAKMFGRVNSESKHGNHCKDPMCLMQQPYGDFTRLIRNHYDGWFCNLCLEDARLANRQNRIIQKRLAGNERIMRPKRVGPPSLPPRKQPIRSLPPRKKYIT